MVKSLCFIPQYDGMIDNHNENADEPDGPDSLGMIIENAEYSEEDSRNQSPTNEYELPSEDEESSQDLDSISLVKED